LVVLVVLIAAGLYIPRRSKTRASDQVAPTQQQQSAQPMQSGNPTTVATPATTTATPNSASDSTAVPAQTTPEPTPSPRNQVEKKFGTKKVAAIPPATQQQAQPEAQTGGAPAQSNDAAELEELEQTVDQLTSRAAAVNSSLDNLRRQQAAQGFGLRGDISSTEEMMKTHLGRAQAALQNQDAKNAKKYSDMASAEVEKLEQFLGR
jgi:hypothetical protein